MHHRKLLLSENSWRGGEAVIGTAILITAFMTINYCTPLAIQHMGSSHTLCSLADTAKRNTLIDLATYSNYSLGTVQYGSCLSTPG